MIRFTLTTLFLLLIAGGTASAEQWQWPLRGELLQRFHYDRSERFQAGQHRGIVIAAGVGTGVRAACSGRVSFAGYVGSSGQVVSVTCGELVASYLHLSVIAVRRGQPVMEGARIGAVGVSGSPDLPQPGLYFGVHRRADHADYIDPLTLFGDSLTVPPLIPAVRDLGGRAPAAGPLLDPQIVQRHFEPLRQRTQAGLPTAEIAFGLGVGLLALLLIAAVVRRLRYEARVRSELAEKDTFMIPLRYGYDSTFEQ